MPPAVLPLTLFGHGQPAISASWNIERTMLDPCCWIDHAAGYLDGADQLLLDLDAGMDWFRGQRLMYGQWLQEPRRTSTVPAADTALPSVIPQIRSSLSSHYDMSFRGLFCNYYETGQDSVAWHADQIGRTEVDPLVAIVSLGGPRTFRLRPHPKRSDHATPHSIVLASGDLLVMGGATQHHWEHAIPKTTHAFARMSVTMRASSRTASDDPMPRPQWRPQDELRGVLR